MVTSHGSMMPIKYWLHGIESYSAETEQKYLACFICSTVWGMTMNSKKVQKTMSSASEQVLENSWSLNKLVESCIIMAPLMANTHLSRVAKIVAIIIGSFM